MNTKPNAGDRVKLRPDVLARHSRSVPAHAGFTTEQFAWRETLNNCLNLVGKIERTFPNSKHVNVEFQRPHDAVLIGIDYTELEPATADEAHGYDEMLGEQIDYNDSLDGNAFDRKHGRTVHHPTLQNDPSTPAGEA